MEDRRDRRAAQPDLHRARARRPLREHGIETIVTLTRFYARVKACSAERRVERVIATNIKEYFPPLLRVLFTLCTGEARRRSRRARAGDHDFVHLLLATSRAASRARAALTPDDPAVLLMSGGTTGTPKGVLGTHGGIRAHRPADRGVDRVRARRRTTCICLPLPLFHVYANVGVQASRWSTATRSRWCRIRATSTISLATIRRVKPAFFTGVPTLYIGLLNHPRRAPARSISSRSSCASPAPRRCWRRPSSGSKRSPADGSSKATR